MRGESAHALLAGRDECGVREEGSRQKALGDVARLRGISIKVAQLGATGSPHATEHASHTSTEMGDGLHTVVRTSH